MKKSAVKKVVAMQETKKNKTMVPMSQQSVPVSKSFTKSEILADISESVNVSRKEVNAVLLRLQDIIGAHVKKALPFSVPGLLKVYVVNRPATEARKGNNPFTKEPTIFKAKPAHKVVKIKPLKKLKAMA